jgi:hypothetical protein
VALNGLVITGAGGGAGRFIARAKIAVPVPPLFAALKVTLKLPETVGVPEMTPLAVLTERPAGKPLAPKLVGLFVAVI